MNPVVRTNFLLRTCHRSKDDYAKAQAKAIPGLRRAVLLNGWKAPPQYGPPAFAGE
jgi:hypothetical protein